MKKVLVLCLLGTLSIATPQEAQPIISTTPDNEASSFVDRLIDQGLAVICQQRSGVYDAAANVCAEPLDPQKPH